MNTLNFDQGRENTFVNIRLVSPVICYVNTQQRLKSRGKNNWIKSECSFYELLFQQSMKATATAETSHHAQLSWLIEKLDNRLIHFSAVIPEVSRHDNTWHSDAMRADTI